MDAKFFLEEVRRMCKAQDVCGNCDNCAIKYDKSSCLFDNIPEIWEPEEIERIVPIVEKWSEEHPRKTRLQDFLEKYPNASLYDSGLPRTLPVFMGYCHCTSCWGDKCPHRKDAPRECWAQEVEENDSK